MLNLLNPALSPEAIIDFCKDFTDKLFIQTMGSKGVRFSLCGGEWQTVAPVPNDNVVDAEGAGDWATSQFIACLCEKTFSPSAS
jgi:sugar/nucleoside kinase (ribokinase family)